MPRDQKNLTRRKAPKKATRKTRRKPSSPEKTLRVQIHDDIPEPSKREAEFLEVLKDEFGQADDLAKAVSRFESEVLQPRYPEGEMSPEEFGVTHFHRLCDDLGQLTLTRKMIRLYGLEDYEKEIMALLIEQIFRSAPARPKHGAVFSGTDEQLLEYQTRESD